MPIKAKKKIKVTVLSLIKKTAGGKHYLCKAKTSKNIFFQIRKPISAIKNLL